MRDGANLSQMPQPPRRDGGVVVGEWWGDALKLESTCLGEIAVPPSGEPLAGGNAPRMGSLVHKGQGWLALG